MSFYVGQKVVCIAEPTADFYLRNCLGRPKKGDTYLIRALDYYGGGTAVFLSEIINPVKNWSNHPRSEPGFHSGFFRPVIERKTDISIFTAMLTPKQFERVTD